MLRAIRPVFHLLVIMRQGICDGRLRLLSRNATESPHGAYGTGIRYDKLLGRLYSRTLMAAIHSLALQRYACYATK